MEKYDICVTGAGASGCACAYIAAKLGLKTILVEKNNYLGGLMTGGLVIPAMKSDSSGINIEFYSDLIKKAKEYNAQIEYFDGNKGWFNPNLLKIVLDDMLNSVGVDIIFEAYPLGVNFSSSHINYIEYSTNILSLHIESKYYLDSTGDSKIFQLLNQNFLEKNIKKQPASLRFIMSGVNIEKLEKFLLDNDSNRDVTNSCKVNNETHLTSAYTWDDKGWQLKPIFDKALENGDLEPFDTAYFQMFTVPNAIGSIAFNCPRLEDYDENSPKSFANSLIKARLSIYRLSKFLIKYFDGFQHAYISQIADMTGQRETNRIFSKKTFTFDDLVSQEPVKTPVLAGDYPIDIHSNSKNESNLSHNGKYYLDINSLISRDFDNLYAAGRNLGADHIAHSALRIQTSCMSMGEAVAKEVFRNVNFK